ncbi:lysine N(6)-hydroxylase/L-ornithine N(5)-oxygenase family protein [Yinghuangia sp. ASG 101]|uniref:lysine N(6)-hydroxylase/L-ornithine N(5)-oxygenase family protein n=1 Tax=Yinghuangia sp. ASG 101 TaxID=2896848 RepID=UPI001E3BF1A3|nr:SidA/IucD/PvdA family monooxygenase [Yinghuangia sp. ASG 101]UGQ15638.1 lysine N(6)-hydroxylase/L-ornithine N(5)-oxygenase family protein [Yinghuangia sp. ASG 101]
MHDLIGVGFGPSNLALAVAVEEHNAHVAEDRRIKALFLEKQPAFGWHRGMLVDGATMQVSFLKDLVTMRNPTSDFSFVSYLHGIGRLVEFINHKVFFPLRVEFHGYLEWAASRVDHQVRYNAHVTAVRPVRSEDGRVTAYDVVVGEGDTEVRHRARNVVLAPGLSPRLPDGVVASERVWHNARLVPNVAATDPARVRTAVVVGAGQSAAETADYLHRRFPEADVHAVFARFGYSPADDSPFANRIFDPDAVDQFYEAPDEVKELLTDYHRNTNYSVVDGDLITELYRRVYEERVAGRQRLYIRHASRVVELRDGGEGTDVDVEFLPTGKTETLRADVVVYATGYLPGDALALVEGAEAVCAYDADGRPRLGRDYRVVTEKPSAAGIYLQGPTEHTHGIGSTLLSNIAVRAGEILASVGEHLGRGTGSNGRAVPGVPGQASRGAGGNEDPQQDLALTRRS